MRREGIKKGIYILPNAFTTANLFCGFFSIISSLNGNYWTAAWVILLAGVFDFLDGRVARLTKTESEFGVEYDSICDVASFGLAPAILMYKFTLFNFSRIGWAAAFVFCACGALRLARFNVQVSDVEKKCFQGLPIPAAAYTLASYVILHYHLFGPGTTESYSLVIMTFVVAILMVSSIPYRSFKALDVNQRASFFFMVIMVGVLFVIAVAPQIMFFVLSVGYVIMGITEEVIRSPKRIRSFKDFMIRYFQANPKEIVFTGNQNGDEFSDNINVPMDEDNDEEGSHEPRTH